MQTPFSLPLDQEAGGTWGWKETVLFTNCNKAKEKSRAAILYGGLRSAWPSRGLNSDFQIWFKYKIKINSLQQTEAKLS